MNRLSIQDRAKVLALLVEGTGINATCRISGVAKNTVLKLLRDVGAACADYQDGANHQRLRIPKACEVKSGGIAG